MSTPAEQPMFYKRVAALNRERHRDWYIDQLQGFDFARESNSVYLAAVEFAPAAHEYPIVFAPGPAGVVLPVALLGLKPKQNLFTNAAGRWEGRYVPAYVRRYPFILAVDDAGSNFTVCIDEAYSGFNTAKEGERLINDDGSEGPLLKRSLEFLKDYQAQVKLTEVFCARLKSLDILEPMSASVELKSGERFSLTGFMCVKRDALKALPAEVLQELVANDFMELIYAHLLSLGNLQGLMARLPQPAAALAG
jgi:hypothetical protein